MALTYAYIPNSVDGTVSVIDTATKTVVNTIAVGSQPNCVCVNSKTATTRVYVSNFGDNTVSVIDAQLGTVIATISSGIGTGPQGIAVSPDGLQVYVVNYTSNNFSVITTATNTAVLNATVTLTSPVGVVVNSNNLSFFVVGAGADVIEVSVPGYIQTNTVIGPGVGIDLVGVSQIVMGSSGIFYFNSATSTIFLIDGSTTYKGVAITPNGQFVYIARNSAGTVSKYNTGTGAITNTIVIGTAPQGVSITPDGLEAYCVNSGSNTVSIVNIASNLVTDTIAVGNTPVGIGSFIGTLACATLTITPATLPDGIVNTFYNEIISATGGIGPYTYNVVFGSLPSGLSLDVNTGVLSGFPDTVEAISFAIEVEDLATECVEGTDYTFTIAEAETPIFTLPPVRVNDPYVDDQYFRLQLFMCCLGTKGADISSRLKIGIECCCEVNTFELLVMYWSVLECYDPTPGATNCLTPLQVDAIWNHISQLCGICFPPYGSTYGNGNANGGFRITENNIYRVTETGVYRIIN